MKTLTLKTLRWIFTAVAIAVLAPCMARAQVEIPGTDVEAATTTTRGAVELATDAEAITGTDAVRAVTPAALAARLTGVASQLALKAEGDYLVSNGTATNRSLSVQMGAVGNLAGSPAAMLTVDNALIPASAPTADLYLASFSTTRTSAPASQVNSLSLLVEATTGKLVVLETGATPASDFRKYASNANITTGTARRARLTAKLTGGSATPPVLTDSGATVASTETTGAGTDPDYLHAALVGTEFQVGYNAPAGRAPGVIPYNYAWSDAEALAWSAGGERPVEATKAGTMVDDVPNGDFQDNSGGGGGNPFAGWYDGDNITSTVETSDPYEGTRSLRFTGAGSPTATGGNQLRSTPSEAGKGAFGPTWVDSQPQQLHRITFAAKHISGGYLYFANGYIILATIPAASASAWTVFVWEGVVPTTAFFDAPVFAAANGAVWMLDAVKHELLGSLAEPIVQPGLTTGDRHGRFSGRMVGMESITDKRTGEIVTTLTWAGSHEAKSLVGGAALPRNAIITSVTLTPTASSGGSGWTVGTVSDPDQFVTANTFAAATPENFQGAQLASPFPGGTAANDLDIVVDPDTANFTGSITATVSFTLANY